MTKKKKMKSRGFIKNTDSHMYEDNEFDIQWATKAGHEIARTRKVPTSIALEPKTIFELKKISEKKGIPYQVLMRSFILEGLERFKKTK